MNTQQGSECVLVQGSECVLHDGYLSSGVSRQIHAFSGFRCLTPRVSPCPICKTGGQQQQQHTLIALHWLSSAHCSLLTALLTAHCSLPTGTHHCSLLTPLGSVRLPLLAFGLSCESGTTSCLNREHNSTRIAARRLSQQAGSNSNSAFTIIFTHTRTHTRAHTHTHTAAAAAAAAAAAVACLDFIFLYNYN